MLKLLANAKFNKSFVVLILMWALPTFATATPCAEGLTDLSFERILDEYAELSFASEEAPYDSPVSTLLNKTLEEKGTQIKNLVRPEELGSIKARLYQKLKTIRNEKNGIFTEAAAQELEARAQEETFFRLHFSEDGRSIRPPAFDAGELSPDGKSFLSLVRKDQHHFTVTLYTLPDGNKILEKDVRSFDTPNFKFTKDGSHVSVEYMLWEAYSSDTKIGSLINFRTLEILNTKTGRSLSTRHSVDLNPTMEGAFPKVDVSPSGKQFMIVKKGTIKVFDESGKKIRSFKVPVKYLDTVKFDASGNNLLIRHFPPRGIPSVISRNIRTKAINWKLEGNVHLLKGHDFIFHSQEKGRQSLPPTLVNSETREIIRTFPETDLRIEDAIVSSDSKLIFIPEGWRSMKGWIYETEKNGARVSINLPGEYFTLRGAQFVDDNQILIGVIGDGKILAWSTLTGAPLAIHESPKNSYLFGVDERGNIIGSPRTTNSGGAKGHTNLQIWDRQR